MKDQTTVMVFNRNGKPIREYGSIEEVAKVYEVCRKTIYKYINSGCLYRRANVFFDWGIAT